MLDTGAQPNIIKKECVHDNTIINEQEILQLTGITENAVNTLGSICAYILQTPIIFHVVPDDFPITQQGILGTSFFKEHDACINYGKNSLIWRNCIFPFKKQETVVIPPRTDTGFVIRVSNPEIKTGYLPRLRICEGVYAGDSLVTCINNKAYVRIINTLDHEIEVIVPTLTLQEVAEISGRPNHDPGLAKGAPSLSQPFTDDPLSLTLNLSVITPKNSTNINNITNESTNQGSLSLESTAKSLTKFTANSNSHPHEDSFSSTGGTHLYAGSFGRTHPRVESFLSAKCTHLQQESLLKLFPSGVLKNYPLPTRDASVIPASISVPCAPEEKAITSTQNLTITINHREIVNIIVNKKFSTLNKICCKENLGNKLEKNFEGHTFCDFDASNRISAILQLLRLDHLTSIERESIVTLVRNNSDRFYIPNEYLGKTHVLTHKIVTTDSMPVHTKQYRFPPIHREEITHQVNQLLAKDIVKPSNSPYNSPIWIVPKKPDSSGNKRWRMVVDYRRLNEKTIGDAYPLPNISDILDQLGSAKYFSVLDLASGFHQIPMDPADAHKTAFSTPHGHYQFARMPFGLKNAPATFQRLMDQILTGLQGIELFVYMDDIVIYASSLREHEIKMSKLMNRLKSANLMLQPDKCEFLRHEVIYLGHIIGEEGVRPDPVKIAAVKEFPTPRNVKNVRQFLGLTGYYRRFIPQFSRIANPLSNLLKKDVIFAWNKDTQEAFDTLRELLCKEPILQYPNFERAFVLTTDASSFAVGGVLSQGEIGQDLPIAYASRVLNSAEKNYSTIEKELLAITYCVNHFRPYLYGRAFTLVTDHQPLTWLYRVKDPTSRLVRWRLKLEEYNYNIVYKKGTSNSNADALSRNPVVLNPISVSVMPIRKRFRLDPNEPSSWNVIDIPSSDNADSDDDRPRKMPVGGPVTGKTLRVSPMILSSSDSEGTASAPSLPSTSRREPISPLFPRISCPASPEGQISPIIPGSIISRQKHPSYEPFDSCSPPQYNLRPRKNIVLTELTDESTDNPSISQDIYTPPSPPIPPEPPPLGNESQNFEPIFADISAEDRPDISANCCRIQETSLPLLARYDNLVVITTADGRPFDNGAHELHAAGKLPPLNNLMLGRANVRFSAHHNRHIIVLPAKEKLGTCLDECIVNDCFVSLLDVVIELQLRTISIRKTDMLDAMPWQHVRQALQSVMVKRPITINICNGTASTPPVEDRASIIREHHESVVGGHKGVTKTYRLIKRRYFWSNMRTQIQEFIRQCHTCQIQKLVRKKTRQPMKLTDTPGQAFDKVALDIFGPLRTTSMGNTYILTMQDLLTKYSIYAPLSNISAESTATAFVNYFICRFGCPRSILTDQGRNFISLFMKNITKKFRIQHFRTTAYHPQSNGSLERSHSVLMEYLKCFVRKEEEWDELIERASFSYNTSVHEGTGFTPHELIFGTAARIPSSFNPEPDSATYSYHLTNLFVKIRDLQRTAKANLEKAKRKSKEYYDKRVNQATFEPGDKVFLINNHKTDKFSAEYLGPYRVIEVLNHENVRIEINSTNRIVHTNKLKKAYSSEPG